MLTSAQSVLLVSSCTQDTARLRGLITEYGFKEIATAETATAVKRFSAERQDIVVINEQTDCSAVGLAKKIVAMGASGVLLLTQDSFYADARRQLERDGVLILKKPVDEELFCQALGLLTAMRERVLAAEQKAKTLETKMNEIKLVERAKWVLIEYLKMSEAQAHRYIEKQAMDRRATRGEIAEGILKTYEN